MFKTIASRMQVIMDLLDQKLITKKEAIMLLNGYKIEVLTCKLGKLFYGDVDE